jgi:hypothetical protein
MASVHHVAVRFQNCRVAWLLGVDGEFWCGLCPTWKGMLVRVEGEMSALQGNGKMFHAKKLQPGV